MDGHWKFRGGGASQKNRKGKYEAKLEFPEGWGRGGFKPKNHLQGRGGEGLFSGTTHYRHLVSLWKGYLPDRTERS